MQVDAGDLVTFDAQFYTDLYLARALSLAGYAILVYECFDSIPDEVRYIWPTRWSTVKTIYLANRYGNLVTLAVSTIQVLGLWRSDAHAFCYQVTLALALMQFVSFASVHVLVLLRAWATWGRHVKVLAMLASLFCMYAAISISVLVWGVVSVGYDAYPQAIVVGTCISVIPPLAWILWLPSLVLECAIFVLTMISIRQYDRHFTLSRQSAIIGVIFRDGVVYFAVTLFSNLFNILVWAFYPNRPLNMLASTFTLCLMIAAGQRLVLDLRKVSGTDTLSTTRVGREVERAIEALPPSRRSPSPIVFSARAAAVPPGTRIDNGWVTADRAWGDRREGTTTTGTETETGEDGEGEVAVAVGRSRRGVVELIALRSLERHGRKGSAV